jgi:hypothetical protein
MDIKYIKKYDKVMKELLKKHSTYGVIKRGPKKGTKTKIDKKYTDEYMKQYFKEYYICNKDKYKSKYIKKTKE